jgi:hypothetical protein
MSYAGSHGAVLPNYRTPRLTGIFNIVFAANIFLYVLPMAVVTASIPLVGKAMNEIKRQIDEKAETTRKVELADVAAKVKSAKTDQEKIELEARRLELESRPKASMPGMFDFNKLGFDEPVFMGWYGVEVVTSVVLNLTMMISGIGLLSYREWARRMAIGTAVFKIIRLVLVYGFAIVVIIPLFTRNLAPMVVEMVAQQQQAMGVPKAGAPPVEFLQRVYMVTYSVIAAGVIVIGSVYPSVVVWLLTRPSTRAACLASAGMSKGSSVGLREL